jgi:putative phage-type endonuclease
VADVLNPAATDRELFLADRRRGIGGSDVAALLGLDPRKTPYQLWRDKLGMENAEGKAAALRRGNFLEAALLKRYAEKVQPAAFQPQVAHQVDGGWRRGNQDARAVMTDGTRRVVEGKTVSRHVFRNEWGTPWTDEVPDRALCQGLWYGNLDDADLIDFAVCVVPDDPDEVLGLTADEVLQVAEFHVFQASRNPDLEQSIVESAHAFWHEHVLPRVPPEPIGEEDVELRWPRHITGELAPAEPVLDLLRRYAEVSQRNRATEKEREDLREQLLLYARGAEALVAADGRTPLLTLKTQDRAAHQVAASTSRVLRFTRWWTKANPTTTPTNETEN